MTLSRSAAFMGPALIFFAAVLWASDAPFRSHLTQGLSSNFIVLAEHAIDLLIAIPLLWWSRQDLKKLTWKEWTAVVFIAVGGSALASIAFTESFRYVNPSVSILLQKVQPLIAITLAWQLLGEKLRPRFWVWTILALGGAYLISFPNLVPQTYAGEAFNPNIYGVLLALAAAVLWGASTVLGKFVLRTAAFQTMTGLRFLVAFVFLSLLNTWQGTIPALGGITTTDWMFLLIIALTSGVCSLLIYYYGLRYTSASIATVAELGFPFAAVFVNAYFIPGNWAPGSLLGLSPGQWIGSLALLFAVFMLSRVNRDEEKSV